MDSEDLPYGTLSRDSRPYLLLPLEEDYCLWLEVVVMLLLHFLGLLRDCLSTLPPVLVLSVLSKLYPLHSPHLLFFLFRFMVVYSMLKYFPKDLLSGKFRLENLPHL